MERSMNLQDSLLTNAIRQVMLEYDGMILDTKTIANRVLKELGIARNNRAMIMATVESMLARDEESAAHPDARNEVLERAENLVEILADLSKVELNLIDLDDLIDTDRVRFFRLIRQYDWTRLDALRQAATAAQ
jgi:hypothetical protein